MTEAKVRKMASKPFELARRAIRDSMELGRPTWPAKLPTWPKGPRTLIVQNEDGDPSFHVVFPGRGLTYVSYDGMADARPVERRPRDWVQWARSTDSEPHLLKMHHDAGKFFYGKWVKNWLECHTKGYRSHAGLHLFYFGMGHWAHDAGPYHGPHGWPGA